MGNEKLEIRNEKLEVELAAWLEDESFAVRAKAVNGKILWWLWLTDKVMVRTELTIPWGKVSREA